MSSTTVQGRVRRGDLAIVECVHSSIGAAGREEITDYAVMVVAGITRDGRVRTVRDATWSDSDVAQPLGRIGGFSRVLTYPQADIDIPGVIATARAHTYPRSTTARAYASLDEVRAALAPHRIRRACTLADDPAARKDRI